ncbi:hypothetical protein, partial [Catellatospora sp. NPDC049609]|uniref:hypothetical protein n=1 Tax=Catellatospora sp. NPDC049609 TaxID=3155505 RepID=UPI00342ECA00
RLAHAGTAREVVVRETATGTVLLRHDTGLAAAPAHIPRPEGRDPRTATTSTAAPWYEERISY